MNVKKPIIRYGKSLVFFAYIGLGSTDTRSLDHILTGHKIKAKRFISRSMDFVQKPFEKKELEHD